MKGNKKEGEITFYYDSKKLFNDVSLLSAYMVKNLAKETGSMLDEFAISEDEKNVYDVCVEQALPNIWEILLKVSNYVEDAFGIVEVKVKENSGLKRDVGTYVEFNIQNNGSYNENVLALVDSTLGECVKYGVLSEFYSINVNADLHKIARAKFSNGLNQLNSRLFQLKKKPISPLEIVKE